LASGLVGGRLVFARRGTPEARILGAFLGISASCGLDVMKTKLKSFTWGGVKPDDTLAGLVHLGLSGEF
jgi:hypothetical protein